MSCDARETHGRTWLGRIAVGLAKRCQQWTRSCVSKGIVEIEWSNGGGAGELDDKIARQLGEGEKRRSRIRKFETHARRKGRKMVKRGDI